MTPAPNAGFTTEYFNGCWVQRLSSGIMENAPLGSLLNHTDMRRNQRGKRIICHYLGDRKTSYATETLPNNSST